MSELYYEYMKDGKEVGRASYTRLVTMLYEGEITPETYIRQDYATEWAPLFACEKFRELTAQVAPSIIAQAVEKHRKD